MTFLRRILRNLPIRASLGVALLLVLSVLGAPAPVAAQGKPHTLPMVGTTVGTPLVMINLSKDHQLFYRAYTEFSDLDGNGTLEKTYQHRWVYVGYFDAFRCYAYSGGDFSPSGLVDDKRYCNGQWSGNFLNWATMARIDVVRWILYGGMRVVDSPSRTVLERTHLPTDAHSFAKYYDGADLHKLTPFTSGPITLCNTTLGGSGGNSLSHTNTNPPLLRAVKGNFQLWNNNERWQCLYSEENDDERTRNADDRSTTGLDAEPRNPSRVRHGLTSGSDGPDFIVRVVACAASDDDANLQSTERCMTYRSRGVVARKPVGLLHTYGRDSRIRFGLMTPSYQLNTSGGVLRRNVASFDDEVAADGSFRSDVKGIVDTIDRLRVYGYSTADDGKYNDSDNCPWKSFGLTDGRCRSWGNPMSELYMESLRYFAGKSATPQFSSRTMAADDALGLQRPAWKDPFKPRTSRDALPGVNACSPLNVINVNASVPSWDSGAQIDITDLGAPKSAQDYTDDVGAGEGLHGKSVPFGGADLLCTSKVIRSLGRVRGLCPMAPSQRGSYLMAGAAYWARTNPIRRDIPVPPDTETLKPLRVTTYGVTLAPNVPVIRIPLPHDPKLSVTLQPAFTLISNDGRGNGTLVDFRVVEQDAERGTGHFYVSWEDSEQSGDYDQDVSGYIKYRFVGKNLHVETRITAVSTGSVPMGFGYAISGAGRLDGMQFHSGAYDFQFVPARIVEVYRPGGRSPINGESGSAINARGGCSSCRGTDAATVAVYPNVTGEAATALHDPLWYAAKWGNFIDLDGDGKPSGIAEWAPRNRASAQFRRKPLDQIPPDGYFFASDPAGLDRSLRSVLETIGSSAQSMSGVTVSRRSQVPGVASPRAFVARYESGWGGDLVSMRLSVDADDDKDFDDGETSAKRRLAARRPADRVIIARAQDGSPVPFRWSSIGEPFKRLLDLHPVSRSDDGQGEKRLEWLRGEQGDEVRSNGVFRDRLSRLGDIVNSSPLYVGPPRALSRPSVPDPGYDTFRTAAKRRTPMVYVGANDGMLHGFDAQTMQERIAYVPRTLNARLAALTDPAYTHQFYVDGSPFAADVKAGDRWRTQLFAPLGAGGQAIVSLDVTDPGSFSETEADKVALWEFTDADDADLGYVIGETTRKFDFEPNQVAKLADGHWYVAIGNGPASDLNDEHRGGGRAALFLLRVRGPGSNGRWERGRDYIKLYAGDETENGLAMPFLIDTDGDGVVDTAYAGDLKGKLWKFDLKSGAASSWHVAFVGRPLFSAPARLDGVQPITAAPLAANLSPRIGGTMVVFGTGSFYQVDDVANRSDRAIYGIWDKGATVTGGDLVQQSFRGESGGLADLTSLPVCLSRNQPSCQSASVDLKAGWFIGLPRAGERVVHNPTVDWGADLIVNSIAPAEQSSCEEGGSTRTTRMSLLSGGSLDTAAFDRNGDGRLDASDARNASRIGVGIRKPMVLMQDLRPCTGPSCGSPCTGVQAGQGGRVEQVSARCPRIDSGRLNWREIVR